MNSLLNHRNDEEIIDEPERQDREITLGTTMLLGIFFALAVLCAVFFGFGYTIGTRRVTAAASLPSAPVVSPAFNGFKPAPGSPAGSSPTTRPASSNSAVPAGTPVANTGQTSTSAVNVPPASGTLPREPQAPEPVTPATGAGRTIPRTSQVAPPLTSAPALAAGVQTVVQIAAVSHQEDADLLISSLKRRGYDVAVRQEPQDKLLHLQIGPFQSRKDADAMRQRLLSDGFNAILK